MAKRQGTKYHPPDDWFIYDAAALARPLVEAEAAAHALGGLPCQRRWREELHASQIDLEVSASCRIGSLPDPAHERAAADAYAWLLSLPVTTRIDEALILELHRRLAIGTRGEEPWRVRHQPAVFGTPPLRGARGGRDCRKGLEALLEAVNGSAGIQPDLIRALALHYHFVMIHPFPAANGRTARALEARLRVASGLTGVHFVGSSAFYNEHRTAYFAALRETREAHHDLTPFLAFALGGLQMECARLVGQLRERVSSALFENTMASLFGRLANGKRQALAHRQVELLKRLLKARGAPLRALYGQLWGHYAELKNPWKAFLRDVNDLIQVGAVAPAADREEWILIRLEWPSEITDERFFDHFSQAPRTGTVGLGTG